MKIPSIPISRWKLTLNEDVYRSDGYVGIGTSTPGGMLGLQNGDIYITADGANNLILADSNEGIRTLTELSDHGSLNGLSGDDHLQYLNRDGSRPMTGDLDLDNFNIVNLGGILGSLTLDGYLLPGLDDAYGLGLPDQRWSDLFLGPDSLHIVSTDAETGNARNWNVGLDSVGDFRITQGVDDKLFITESGSLLFGGKTSSYPAIKRVAATLQARLADDSGYANLGLQNLDAYGDISAGHIYSSTGALNLGTIASTGHSLATGDVLIGGSLEVDSSAYFDSLTYYYSNAQLVDNIHTYWGTSADVGIRFHTGQLTAATMQILVDNASRIITITEMADKNVDLGIPAQENPTLVIKSADESTISDILTLSHNQTDGYIGVSSGGLHVATNSGRILMTNSAGDDFDLLQLGGTTSSFPAIQRSGSRAVIRRADDATYASFAALNIQAYANIVAALVGTIGWTDSTQMRSGTDGELLLVDYAETDFNLLQLGGTTSAYPAIKRVGQDLHIRRADDSDYSSLAAQNIQAEEDGYLGWIGRSKLKSNQDGRIKLTDDAGTSGVTFRFSDGNLRFANLADTTIDVDLYGQNWNGTGNVRAGTASRFYWINGSEMSSPSDGGILFTNDTADDFGLLQLGGTTSAFPAIKRTGQDLHLRRSDDSTYASLALQNLDAYGDITMQQDQRLYFNPSCWLTATASNVVDFMVNASLSARFVPGGINIIDSDSVSFGSGTDYWMKYNSPGTQFELWTTNADGVGTDGVVLSVTDGTDDVDFAGDVSLENTQKIVLGSGGDTYLTSDTDQVSSWLVNGGNAIWISSVDGIKLYKPTSMTGNYIYDDLGILELGGAMTTAHGLGVGDVGVANDMEIAGNLYVDGTTEIAGDLYVDQGTSIFDGYLLPSIDDAYGLGLPTQRWSDLFLGHNSLHIIGTADEIGVEKSWSIGLNDDGEMRIAQGSEEVVVFNSAKKGLQVGEPTDGSFTGILPIQQDDTVADTLDQINDLLDLISPEAPGVLTGQNISLSISSYSAKLPTGLSSAWNPYTPGNTITGLIVTGTYYLASADTSTRFNGGLTTSDGGTVTHVLDGADADSRDVDQGAGSTGTVQITDVSTYNNIWQKINAQINRTQTEGQESHALKHTLAGTSNTTTLYYDDTNDTPSFSASPTVSVASETLKYLSGIAYYYIGTEFDVSFTAAPGIFRKAYHISQVARISGQGLANTYVNPSSTPAVDDSFAVTDERVTLTVANSVDVTPNLTVLLRKPNNTTASQNTPTLSRYILTYGTQSTSTYDNFVDEAQRLVVGTGTSWTSSSALTNGNAQVRGGTLQFANSTDYPGFSGDQVYERRTTKASASSGTIVFGGLTTVATEISSYGTGDLNVFLQLETDGVWFDLGRSFGDNSNGDGSGSSPANSKGARVDGSTSGNSLAFSFGTYNTAGNSNQYRVRVVFRTTSKSLTSITGS